MCVAKEHLALIHCSTTASTGAKMRLLTCIRESQRSGGSQLGPAIAVAADAGPEHDEGRHILLPLWHTMTPDTSAAASLPAAGARSRLGSLGGVVGMH